MTDMKQYPLSAKTRNLVRFCRHLGHEALDESFMANFGFRDAKSRFSILKSIKTAPGPDECYSHGDIDARPLFDKLLGMEVEYPGQLPAQQERMRPYNTMNYYRSHIEEFFYHNGVYPLPPVEGTCNIFFAGTDTLAVHYTLKNTSQAPVDVRLRWFSAPSPGLRHEARVGERGFSYSCVQKVNTEYQAGAVVTAPEGVQFTLEGEMFRSESIERHLPPGETLALTFQIDFALRDKPIVPAPATRTLETAIRETEAAYALLPELPTAFAQFASLVLKAVGTLRSLRYEERDLHGQRVATIHAGKCGTAATWFWDGAFTLLGLGIAGDQETGQGMAGLLIDGITPDGKPPCTYANGAYRHDFQQPILAWGVGHLASMCTDLAFLQRSYAPLGRYVNHWLEKYDINSEGLAVYPPGGTCWDDSLRWQSGFPLAFAAGTQWWEAKWGRMRADQFENVDTNTYLYLECRTLARIAGKLGYNDEAQGWEARAQALAERINTLLYDEATGVYQDRCTVDGRFSGLITPSCFMPLYAGIVPQQRAQRICREYLLNPERFYTTLPFPTLDRSHPAYRSGGFLHAPPEYPGALVHHSYWIGRTWPHVSYWMVGALYQSGLHTEAEQAAMDILDGMNRNEAIHECYDSLTGYGNGHPEFMWSSAAVLALAYQMYQGDPVGLGCIEANINA